MPTSGTQARWLVGVDIGGTFTDLVAIELVTGRRAMAKSLTTPSDPAQGILDAFDVAAAESGVTLERTATFVHATTLAINTVIERTGAKVGLIATEGFTDVLEIGHGNRYDMFDLQIQKQAPLVERRHRVPLVERMSATGTTLTPLDLESQMAALERLQEEDVESVAVSLLHAYRNGSHEEEIKDAVASTLALPVSISSAVAPIIREYERTLATVVNAYLSPRVATYLSGLADELRRRGFTGEPKIMRSDGGWFSAPQASHSPVRILESGPAAGAIAAAQTAVQCGAGLSVAFDMGGTTAKGCLVVDGEPSIADGLEVSRLERFKQGSGLPIALPSVDLIEIGAGGGSIASIGALGLLQVGPESSSAAPGPACYGRGGARPTVTDADLVLGYLNPEYFAGGSLTLDLGAAREAIDRELVGERGLRDVTAAAWGVHDLVNENMARAVRLHCIEHGVHPTGMSIVATGGAGPLHATGLMGKIGAARVICPPGVGVASAFGLLLAPRMDERTVTDIVALDDLDEGEIERRLDQLATTIDDRGWSEMLSIRRFVTARLRGQGYDVRVALPARMASTLDVSDGFRAEYTRRFGRAPSADGNVEVVDWTVRFSEPGRELHDSPTTNPNRTPREDATQTRAAYWGPDVDWLETAAHRRDALVAGASIHGPAVIEEPTSTVVVRPGQIASVDAHDNIEIVSSDA